MFLFIDDIKEDDYRKKSQWIFFNAKNKDLFIQKDKYLYKCICAENSIIQNLSRKYICL
jgi:hypothetical protein